MVIVRPKEIQTNHFDNGEKEKIPTRICRLYFVFNVIFVVIQSKADLFQARYIQVLLKLSFEFLTFVAKLSSS